MPKDTVAALLLPWSPVLFEGAQSLEALGHGCNAQVRTHPRFLHTFVPPFSMERRHTAKGAGMLRGRRQRPRSAELFCSKAVFLSFSEGRAACQERPCASCRSFDLEIFKQGGRGASSARKNELGGYLGVSFLACADSEGDGTALTTTLP